MNNKNKDLKAALYVYPAVFVIVLAAGLLSQNAYVYAGEPATPEECYDAGYRNGQNYPFSSEGYEECDVESKFKDGKNQYSEGVLDGCDDVEGNSREECEQFMEE
jgi:hypothetical protein